MLFSKVTLYITSLIAVSALFFCSTLVSSIFDPLSCLITFVIGLLIMYDKLQSGISGNLRYEANYDYAVIA